MPDNIKKINSRIQMKNATAVDWKKAVNFSPLKGEMIIYSGDPPRLKVGDGTTNVNDLPFTSAAIYVGDTAPTGNYDLWIDTSMDTGDDTVQVVIFTQEEKSKLAGIEAGANKYVLPTAGAELGGVKTTSTVSDATGLTATPIIDGVPYYKEATPNWNENDSTSKNYIDNRPGAFTKTETITLTATAEARNEGDTTTTSLEFAFPDNRMDLIPGETYQVVWDGQTYNWEAKIIYVDLQDHILTYSNHGRYTMPYYIMCGYDIVGEFETGAKKAQRQDSGSDSDDELPITIMSTSGGVVGTEYYLGRLMLSSNTSLTVGASYSITITGKFDYKLYSMTREGENVNSVWATGIFDNAALYMANVYTNAELANYTPSWDNLTDRPGAYFDDTQATTADLTFSFKGSTSANESAYVSYYWDNGSSVAPQSVQETPAPLLRKIVAGQSYTVVWSGTTYSNVVARDYYGTMLLGGGYYDNADGLDFSSFPFLLEINGVNNEIAVVTPSSTEARIITCSIHGYNPVEIPGYFLDLTAIGREFVYNNSGEANNLTLQGSTIIYTDKYDSLQFKSSISKPDDNNISSSYVVGALSFNGCNGGTGTYADEGNGFHLLSACFEKDTENNSWVRAGDITFGLTFKSENPADSLYLLYRDKNNIQFNYSVLTSASIIPITSGGTGATTAAGALTSLGAFPISGGTLTGAAMAGADAQKTLSTSQLRNITISTTDLVEGESTLAEGEIYLVYDGGEA